MLLCMCNFSIIAYTSPKNQHCLGEEGDESEVHNKLSAKCPVAFHDYCR